MRLTRAEWLKLSRRPLVRVLLVVFLALLALQSVVYALAVEAHALGIAGLGTAFRPEQLAEYRRRAVFPGMIGAVLGHLNGLGGLFAVVLAGAAMGSEYEWGTIRTQLCRTPDRTAYLAAKVATLLLLLLAGAAITLAFGLGLGAALGCLIGGPGVPDAATLAAVPGALLRALYVLLPYVLLAVSLAIARGSLLFAVAGGLVYLAFEAGFGAVAIFAALGEPWRTIYGLTIGQNINALTLLNDHAFGLRPEALSPALRVDAMPAPLEATIVIGVYALLLFAAARRGLEHDLTRAG